MKNSYLFLIILLIQSNSFAQQKNDLLNTYYEGNHYFQFKAYEKALTCFKKVENKSSDVFRKEDLIFNIGVCYFYSNNEQNKAIDYFEKYIEEYNDNKEAYYFLARSYHFFHEFNLAIKYYELYNSQISPKDFKSNDDYESKKSELNYLLDRCKYGKMIFADKTEVIVENLGPIVNSKYSEYAPVINSDESKLVFTKRSPETTGGKLSPDGDYFEDIFIVDITDGRLFEKSLEDKKSISGYFSLLHKFKSTKPVPISSKINTKNHEGAIQFLPNDEGLLIYSKSDVWVSKIENNQWQSPEKLTELHDIINSKAHEPSVSIAKDNSLMFISSDRPGGYGGLDLYVATKSKDGTWSEAVNLGPTINTKYDEDGPYIDPNGTTLYFSSKGHSSIGGFDVFKSKLVNNEWGIPKNLGYPVNSAGDDIFYMMTPLFNRAYYSSNKYGGYGKMDIYRLTFANERQPLAEIKGLVKKGDKFEPAKSKITVLDAITSAEIYSVNSDSISGGYHLMVGHGNNYEILVETEGFLPYKKSLQTPNQVFYFHHYQEVHHIHIKDKKGNIIGEKVEMQNYMADSKENIINMDSISNTEQNQNLTSNVTFYIPPDSVETLLQTGALVISEIPEEANVIFYNPQVNSIKHFDFSYLQESSTLDNIAAMFIKVDTDFIKQRNNIKSDTALTDDLNIISTIPSLEDNSLMLNSQDIINNSQTTLARVNYSLESFYETLEHPDSPEIQQIAAVNESNKLIKESLFELRKSKILLQQDSAHALAALESIKESELTILKLQNVIERFKSQPKLTENNDSLNFYISKIKQLIGQTQASLMQTELALSMTPEPYSDFRSSYKQTLQELEQIENQITTLNLDIYSNEFSIDKFREFKFQIISAEISILKTIKLLNTELSLPTVQKEETINYLISMKNMLSKIESELVQIQDLLEGYDIDNTELEIKISDTKFLMDSISNHATNTKTSLISIEQALSNFPINEQSVLNEKSESETESASIEQPHLTKLVVYFEFNSDKLNAISLKKLNSLCDSISSLDNLKINLFGHTDSKGSKEYNHQLSLRRSEIVQSKLSFCGITKSAITIRAMGESQPIAPNTLPNGEDNPNGRKLNRRVEVEISSTN